MGNENNKVVLVLEDEKPLLEAIRIKLEKNNFSVVTARSVEQAKQYFDDLDHVDVIWLDHYLLGKENGLDFIKRFKANGGRWKNIPVFVVSNTEGAKTIQSYVELGISKYYVKSNHRLDEIIDDINASLK